MSDTRAPLASVGGDGGGTSRGRPDGPGSGCQSSLSQMWATGEAGGGDWGAWPPPSRAAWRFPQPQGRVEVGKAVVGGVCHALEGRPGADSESVAGPLWPLRQVISGPSSPSSLGRQCSLPCVCLVLKLIFHGQHQSDCLYLKHQQVPTAPLSWGCFLCSTLTFYHIPLHLSVTTFLCCETASHEGWD